jgi:hypothetical protein
MPPFGFGRGARGEAKNPPLRSSVLPEALLARLAVAVAGRHQAGAVQALTRELAVLRIAVADAHQSARLAGGVNGRTVIGIDMAHIS